MFVLSFGLGTSQANAVDQGGFLCDANNAVTFLADSIFGTSGEGITTFFVDDAFFIPVVIGADHLGFSGFDVSPTLGMTLDHGTSERITVDLFSFGVHLSLLFEGVA